VTRIAQIALICAIALVADAPAAAANVPKGPSGLELYKPPKNLKSYEQGDLIWAAQGREPPAAGEPHLDPPLPLDQPAREGDRRVRLRDAAEGQAA
jgi:hypothetical protein